MPTRYNEAGTYDGHPRMDAADTPELRIGFPPAAVGQLHVILEVTDNGQPPLTSYRRVVVQVEQPAAHPDQFQR
ncbi:MAG: hypothetical protein ACYC6Y_02260 [Thermoguttaceae bacterium]